jgi:hypothetical protein
MKNKTKVTIAEMAKLKGVSPSNFSNMKKRFLDNKKTKYEFEDNFVVVNNVELAKLRTEYEEKRIAEKAGEIPDTKKFIMSIVDTITKEVTNNIEKKIQEIYLEEINNLREINNNVIEMTSNLCKIFQEEKQLAEKMNFEEIQMYQRMISEIKNSKNIISSEEELIKESEEKQLLKERWGSLYSPESQNYISADKNELVFDVEVPIKVK